MMRARACVMTRCSDLFRELPARNGAPEGIRTPDPQIRSLVLYPAELPAPRVPVAQSRAQAKRPLRHGTAGKPATGWPAGALSRQDLERGLTKQIARRLHGVFRFPLPGDREQVMPAAFARHDDVTLRPSVLLF